jgi:hypothetical protein
MDAMSAQEQQPQEGTSMVPSERIDKDPVNGRFLPGNQLGFKRAGSANKLTKAMRLAAIEEMAAAGDQGNPLLILYRIGANPDTPLKLRADVAFKLATLLWGVKNTFEIEAPDQADEERIARTRRIFTMMFAEESTNEQSR